MHAAHALILTALTDEASAIKALAPAEWTRQTFNDTEFYWRREVVRDGRAVVLALVDVNNQGSAHMAAATVLWAKRFGARHLALSGICAGKRGGTALGDVILFKTVYDRTGGKRVGQQPPIFDNKTYRPQPNGVTGMAENFVQNWTPHPSVAKRPPTIQKQAHWYLTQLRDVGVVSAGNSESCPSRAEVEKWLEKEKIIESKKVALSVEALREKLDELNAASCPVNFNAKEGVTVCDVYVTVDDEYFKQVALDHSRDIIGLEMEAAGFLIGAEKVDVDTAIVAKGVQDYAALDKDDVFREYGAKAAGSFCVDFLIDRVMKASPPIDGPEMENNPIEEAEALKFLKETVGVHSCSHIVGAKSSGKTLFLHSLEKHIKQRSSGAVVISTNFKVLVADDANAMDFTNGYIEALFKSAGVKCPEKWKSEAIPGRVEEAIVYLHENVKRDIYIIVDNGDVVRRYAEILEQFFAKIAKIARDPMYSRIRQIFSFSADPNEFLPPAISPFNAPPLLLLPLSVEQVRSITKDSDEETAQTVYALTRGNRALTRLLLDAVNRSGMALSSDVERLPPPVNEYVEQLRSDVAGRAIARQALKDVQADSSTPLPPDAIRYLLRNGLIRAKGWRDNRRQSDYEIDNAIIEAMVRRL